MAYVQVRLVGGRWQENRRGRERIVVIPGSAGLILNCGADDIKSGSSWDDGGRRSLVKGLASRWACTAVCSHASCWLTRLLGRHLPMRSGDSWRHVNAHGFNSESVRLNVTGLCSKIPWLFICATCHKQLVSNWRKNLRSNICAISRDHAQFQEFMLTFGFSEI